MRTVADLLHEAVDRGGLEAEELRALLGPLWREIAVVHEQGHVAPLRGLGGVAVGEANRLTIAGSVPQPPSRNRARLDEVQGPLSRAFSVVGHRVAEHRVGEGSTPTESQDVIRPGEVPTRPVFVVGYETWEQQIGHHDAASDIEYLGLLLASLALGLDFRVDDDLRRYAASRGNPFALRADLHPVIARLMGEMAEPDRTRRAQDITSLAERLDSYREQPVDFDLALVPGATAGPIPGRRAAIQTALRDRLFEINRRNRLVYFSPTQQSVNLTVGSVPLLLDVAHLDPDQVATWKGPLAADIVAGRSVKLNTVLRFEEAPYLPPALTKLISQARRDRAEYGVAQLRLVVAFLRWHNLKEVKEERINSPLLLLPVEMTTKRGVRDSYVMKATTAVAEVNPALRHHLRQTYAIELPETVDLEEQTVDELHRLLQAQIEASEPGVVLEKVDRPQLALVQQRARMRVDQYRRRQRAATRRPTTFSYSYAGGDARPLGIQQFDRYVRYRPPERLRIAAGAPPPPRAPGLAAPAADVQDRGAEIVTERSTYVLGEPRTGNPYRWDFDLCSLTLANFNYRKMTLVRDYAQLIAADEPSDAFDRIFSLDARPLDDVATDPPLADQYLVVPADATQRAAIARARAGRSFIIQGPPGTGKSQTITNLIADYVARGKRVLFVCEKRAAIDVVHARLRKQGLDDLCALIHDSQADKKAFIHGMRATYERWLMAPDDAVAVEAERARLVESMTRRLDALRRFDAAMSEPPPGSHHDLRALLERAVALRDASPGGPPDRGVVERDGGDGPAAAELPDVTAWYEGMAVVERLAATLASLGEPPILARHPIADVRSDLLAADRPTETLTAAASDLVAVLDGLRRTLPQLGLSTAGSTVGGLADLRQLARVVAAVPDQALPVLLPASAAAGTLGADATRLAAARAAAQQAGEAARGWREPLDPADATAALAVASAKEPSALKFLSGDWRRVKKTVQARYDFGSHAVRPTATKVLTDLIAWHAAADAERATVAEVTTAYGTGDLDALQDAVTAVHGIVTAPVVGLRAVVAADGAQAATHASALRASADELERAVAAIDGLYDDTTPGLAARSVDDLADRTARLRGASGAIRELAGDLQRLDQSAPAVARAARALDRTPAELEADVLARAIDQFGLRNLDVERFSGADLAAHLAGLQQDLQSLLDVNAAVVDARARARFGAHVAVSAAPAAQLPDADAKAFKKAYSTGRRELEHEFQKTMRYRSIRDLASGAPAPVVMDLRPIWLMSPLSVSDTLPLDPGRFDVVVFDEASQIPLEETVPALYRSHQTIVVGDQMQLPPTTFFSAGNAADDAELEVDDGDGQRVAVVLDGDSFLAQSAASLPSTMLQWHYRSRSEDLIGFSNAAFYGGGLATVPDRHRPPDGLAPIDAAGLTPDGAVDAVLARNISFHLLPDAVYESRRNRAEAAYVAETVRALLRRRLGLTIGIAAFSEAQQTEIEEALDRLAEDDDEFADLLDAEEQREDDDQFVGLFVKNLENIQGDERDVIIISVCYGPGPGGRMLMNFGPINQQGGEKRLNVIFSRARQRMMIVSSIHGPQITNEHNDGANALRRFLEYAEALSAGATDRAQLVLDAVNPLGRPGLAVAGGSPVVAGLAAALRARGLAVAEGVGRSRFRCDLAVRRPEDGDHRVAVLVDTRERAALAPSDERAITHPAVLHAFGWTVVHVLTKDWHADPAAVVAAVEAAVAG